MVKWRYWLFGPTLPFVLLVAIVSLATQLPSTWVQCKVHQERQVHNASNASNASADEPKLPKFVNCSRPIPARKQTPQLGPLTGTSKMVNFLVATSGPLWPYVVLLVQAADGDASLGTCSKIVCIFVVMTLLRLISFVYIMRPVHYYVSDHIVLVTSMLAQLQICSTLPKGPSLTYWMTWLMVLPCLFEAFLTAWFYHTRQASWVGLLVGAVIFQSCAVGWICSYKQDESEAKEHSDEYAKMHDQENRSSGSKK